MALTQDLGRFVSEVSFVRLPQGAADVARTGFIDCIATMIAGTSTVDGWPRSEATSS